eukprot:326711-Pelagomonas_calceolata.AAC.3
MTYAHLPPSLPQPVRDPVALHRLEAFEVQQALAVLGARRVSIYHSLWMKQQQQQWHKLWSQQQQQHQQQQQQQQQHVLPKVPPLPGHMPLFGPFETLVPLWLHALHARVRACMYVSVCCVCMLAHACLSVWVRGCAREREGRAPLPACTCAPLD